MKKNKLELMEWYCAAGKHIVIGGPRYANFNGGHDCAKHTPYLREK